MTATLAHCSDALSRLGCELPLDESALRPGQERVHVITFLVDRLVKPASLAQLFARLDDLHPQPRLAEEERHAQRFVTLLKQIGVVTTLDTFRGCTTTAESLELLHKLIALVQLKEGPTREEQGLSQQQPTRPPLHLSSYMPLLEFACTQFPRLTAESSQLFPSDITKAMAKHSAQADAILSNSQDWSCSLSESIALLKDDVQRMSQQISHVDDGTWHQLLSDLVASLHEYLAALGTFSDIYAKELGVWCESLPPTQLHGLGPKAASMLATYKHAASVIESIKTIRTLHRAITSSGPPLTAYQPRALLKIAEGARREAALLSKQVAVLNKGIERQGPHTNIQHQSSQQAARMMNAMETD